MKQNQAITTVCMIALLPPIFSNAQDIEPKYGKDSIQCVQNLSVYNEFVKQKNYDDAFNSWKYAFDNCPRSSKKLYVDGVKILEQKIRKEKSADRKELYIDTLLLLYDKRIKYFNEEGYVLGRKGVDLYQYRKNKAAEAMEILQKSVVLQGKKSEAGTLVVLMQIAVELVKGNMLPKEKLFELYDNAGEIVDYNLAKDTLNRVYYEPARNNIDALFSPFADCDVLATVYEPKFRENKQDTLLLKKILRFLINKNCTSTPFYAQVAEALYSVAPSAFAASNLGKLFVEKGQFGKATSYLQQAVELETDNQKKGEYYLDLTRHYFYNLNQNEQARNYALKAANFSSAAGKAYLLMGDIYVASAKSCGTNAFEISAVYWAAVDKYMQAKGADASVSDDAAKKIATYSQYFPPKADAFFYGFTDGQEYKVGCWINETTKVRVLQ